MSFTPSPNLPESDDAALLWSFLNSLAVDSNETAGPSSPAAAESASALIGVLHRANAAQSPATRLYSHALESIFGFCSLVDLLSAAATHRQWRRAVPRMRCLRSTLQLKHFTRQLHTVWVTQVAPHIVALEPSWDAKNAEIDAPLLSQLAHHMPHLESLTCEMLLLGTTGELVLPARLRSLKVTFPSGPHVTTDWLLCAQAAVTRSCAALPLLHTLELRFPVHSSLTDFSPLSACTALRTLTWSWRDSFAKLTTAQAKALTRLPTLERLNLPWMLTHLLPLLTAAPGPLSWASLGRWDDPSSAVDFDTVGALLVMHLPQLSELTAMMSCSLLLLPRLRNLTSLSLGPSKQAEFVRFGNAAPRAPEPSLDAVGEAVAQCSGLTALSIREVMFPDAWLRTVLARLPELRILLLSSDSVSALDGICASAPALRRLELAAPVFWGVRAQVPRSAEWLAPLLSLRWLEECTIVRLIPAPVADQWYREVQQARSMPRLAKFVAKIR